MQVWRGHSTGGADFTHWLAMPDFLTEHDVELRQVRVVGFVAVAMIQDDQAAVSAFAVGKHYDTVRGGLGRRTHGSGNIHTRVIRAFTGERIRALAVAVHQQTIPRPVPAPRILVPWSD